MTLNDLVKEFKKLREDSLETDQLFADLINKIIKDLEKMKKEAHKH